MPSLIGSLFVSLTADFAPFQRNMKSAEGVVASTSAGMRRNIGLTERSVASFNRTTSSNIKPYALISAARTFDTVQQRANLLRGALFATTAAFGGLGAALTTNVVSRYLDSFTGLENQMRVVSTGSADLAGKMDAVQSVAQSSRASLAAVATLYSRIAKAAPGESAQKILNRVETINKALQLGGATAQEAASAAIQFSQAIASNRLGGEELRAVLETPLGLELAKGMGVTLGQFRKLSIQGKLTADVLFKSLDKISGSVNEKFAQSISTIDQALTVADGQITKYAGSLDDAYGITKLITSAIRGFGNNLGTIVPILAQAAIGMGTLFGGRLAGGAIGSRFTALRDGVRSVTDARKEELRIAEESFGVATKQAQAATAGVGTARNTLAGGNLMGLAPKGQLKAYQRDIAAVQKADANHLALLEQKSQTAAKLSEIYRTSTVGELKAAESLADAQGKVNAQLGKQWSLQAQIAKVNKQIGNLPNPGHAPQWAMWHDVAAKEAALITKRTQLTKELGTVEARLAKDRDTAAARQASLTAATSATFTKAANERATVLVNEKRLTQDLAASDARRAQLVASARNSRGVAEASGFGLASKGLSEAEGTARAAASRVIFAGQAMREAAKGAGALATGMGLIRAAGGSLIGFLGGPWGVAFTVAIGTLAYFGAKARATAEEIAAAQDIIAERIGKLADSGKASVEEQKTILQGRIEAETKQLELVTKELSRTRDELATTVAGLVNDPRVNALPNSEEVIKKIQQISGQFRDGTISIEEMVSKIRELGVNTDSLNAVVKSLSEQRLEADRAALAIKEIDKSLGALNGQQADITIRLNVDDPRGVFQLLSGKQVQAGETSRLAKQYAQYGAGHEAARNQTALQNQRQSVMAAAGEEDKVKNTPQKIRDRAQALYEEAAAYGGTWEQAQALAKAELDLTEKTRLASAASTAAAKEFQSFANKLAELKAEGEGAFLSDVDQKVLDFAKSLKDGSGMMREYIAAVNSGDLSKAPKQLLEARDAILELGAAATWQDVLKKYGDGAQLAGLFAEKQAELAIAMQNTSMTAGQAAVAYGEFVTSFGQFEWIGQMNSALTGFLGSAITDFDNLQDAALKFADSLLQIALQAFALKPLEQFLNGLVGGFATGGGFFGGGAAGPGIGSFQDVFELHDGSPSVGNVGGRSRGLMPSSVFAGAPRFHRGGSGGIKGNEMAAILERGEAVLRGRDHARSVGLISGMGGALSRGSSGTTVQIIDQVGTKKRTEQSRGPNGEDMLKIFIEDTVDGSLASGRHDGALGGRFGARPVPTRR